MMLRAQTPATYRYEHDPAYSFIYSGSDVMIKYIGTSTYNEGIVKFQPIQDNTTLANVLQITIVDGSNGSVQYNEVYSLAQGEDLVPIACTYHPVLENYLVTGVCQNNTGGNSFSTWYMLFDNNFNLLNANLLELQSSNTYGITPFTTTQSTVVTDVSYVTVMGSNRHFVFTGLLLRDGTNTVPYVTGIAPTDRRLFVAVLDAVGNVITESNEYYFFNNPPTQDVTQFSFPSRIIEVKSSNPTMATRGYLIGGTTVNQNNSDAKQAFYLRLFADLQLMDHKLLDVNMTDYILAVGDLFQEETNGDVLVAGTITHRDNSMSTQYYFFDKLNDIPNGINVASKADAWPTNGGAPSTQFGIYKIASNMPKLRGFPKVGRISYLYNNSNLLGNVITASVCRNDFYQNNTYYSDLLPFTMLVRYDDASLDFWPTTQNTSCELYPRWDGMLGPVAFYQGMSFDSPWYPNHISFEYSHANRLFSLGQLGVDQTASGDYDIVNIVDRPNSGHNCYEDNQVVDAEYMAVDFNILTIFTNSISRTLLPISPQSVLPVVQVDECSGTNLFRLGNNDDIFGVSLGEMKEHDIEYTEWYSVSGALVKREKGRSENNNQGFLMGEMAQGIYVLKTRYRNGQQSYQKVIKY